MRGECPGVPERCAWAEKGLARSLPQTQSLGASGGTRTNTTESAHKVHALPSHLFQKQPTTLTPTAPARPLRQSRAQRPKRVPLPCPCPLALVVALTRPPIRHRHAARHAFPRPVTLVTPDFQSHFCVFAATDARISISGRLPCFSHSRSELCSHLIQISRFNVLPAEDLSVAAVVTTASYYSIATRMDKRAKSHPILAAPAPSNAQPRLLSTSGPALDHQHRPEAPSASPGSRAHPACLQTIPVPVNSLSRPALQRLPSK